MIKLFNLLSILFCFFSSLCNIVNAQIVNLDHAIWDQTEHSIKTGLPIPQLTCSYIDAGGVLWGGGQAGLFRFDGYEYYIYGPAQGLKNTWVNCLTGDNNGLIYSGTKSGLAIIRNNKVSMFNLVADSIKSIDEMNLLSNNEMLVASGSQIWLLSNLQGKIKPSLLFSIPNPNGFANVVGLARDKQGRIYVSANIGFFIYYNNQVTHFHKASTSGNVVIDKYDNVWFSTNTVNKLSWQNGSPVVTDFFSVAGPVAKVYPQLTTGFIENFCIQGDSIIVYSNIPGTDLPGEPVVDKGYYFLTVYSIKSGKKYDIKGVAPETLGLALDVRIDKEENYWLTHLSGFYKIKKMESVLKFAYTEGAVNFTEMLKTDAGDMFVASELHGLYKVQNGQLSVDPLWARPISVGGLEGAELKQMIQSKNGDIWYTTLGNGILRRCKDSLHVIKYKQEGPGYNFFMKAFQASNGFIYFGGYGALQYFDGSVMKGIQSTSNFSVAKTYFSGITEDKNSGAIILSSSGGLHSYLNGTFKNISKELELEGVIPGICTGKDGTLWIGTYGKGLLQAKLVNGRYKVIRSVTVANGLSDNNIDGIVTDTSGRIWATSFRGYHLIDLKNDKVYVTRITSQMLLDQYYFRALSLFSDANGNVFGGTGKAVLQLNIPRENSTQNLAASIPLHITGFQVFNKDIENHDSIQRFPYYLSVPENPVLKYDQNHITINFRSVYFTDPQNVKYIYKLEGDEGSEWTTPSDDRSVTYSKLPPGKYIFKVRANVNGELTPVTEFPFTIKKPWWQTAWFRIMMALSLIGILWAIAYYFYRAKIKRANAKVSQLQQEADRKEETSIMEQSINENKIKALQAQMNPHFIFNVLSSLQNFIRGGNQDKSEQLLVDFGGLIRKSLDISGQNYISIQQEVNYLEEYIKVEQQRTGQQFQFNINIDKSLSQADKYYIPGMLLQPIVENAIIHGLLNKTSSPALLDIKLNMLPGNLLECKVRDNGEGIKESIIKTHKPVAVSNIKERLSLYSKHLQKEIFFDIQNIANSGEWETGTEVIIRVPCLAMSDIDKVNLN